MVLQDAVAIVFVVDCFFVLLASERAVAALHCGWRSLASGIVAEGVRALREVGGDGPIQAAVGLGARGCCKKIKKKTQTHSTPYNTHRRERNLNLTTITAEQLHQTKVNTIHNTSLCTIC